MKTLIVYDSEFGNTAKVAKEMGKTWGKEALVKQVGEVEKKDWQGLEKMIIGSPTQGGRPTEAVWKFLDQVLEEKGKKIKIACFDTRLDKKRVGVGLKLLMKTIGYAAGKMAKKVEEKGVAWGEAKGFLVEGKEGPLKEGEMERARVWMEELKKGE